MTWTAENSHGNEAAKIRWEVVPYTRGFGLDLGCGPNKCFPHFVGVDNRADTYIAGVCMDPDFTVPTCEKLPMFATESCDFIFSSHLLEHIADYKSALLEWWRLLKVGGHLVLYLPDEDEYPKVGEIGANVDHKWDVNYDRVVDALKDQAWDLVRFEKRNQEDEYSLFFVFRKLAEGQRFSYLAPKPQKTCAIVRYGAFGDMIMASSILPGLKAQGYHITMFTTPRGQDIVRNDPNIDEFFIQDTDQVPPPWLRRFWDYQQKKYDKWVNLSESVEGALLPQSSQSSYFWPHEVRHKRFNVNYLELTHDIAGVPHKFNARFYATDDEKEWAGKEKESIGGKVILWSLSGSAVHKSWPWMDRVIARLMLETDVKVVLVGDDLCQMLEHPWRAEPRVILKSGKWSIRETLAFAEVCDLVVGSETGVLNAVGMSKVKKIVTLSHSSKENLTKHWTNTIVLTPKDTPCYPCHRMHMSFEHCHRGPVTGVALCQENISPDDMWSYMKNIFRR